jgi:hypothetical protein
MGPGDGARRVALPLEAQGNFRAVVRTAPHRLGARSDTGPGRQNGQDQAAHGDSASRASGAWEQHVHPGKAPIESKPNDPNHDDPEPGSQPGQRCR